MLKKLVHLVFLCILLITIHSCDKSFILSETEENWLAQQDSVIVALFPYYPPYQFINEQNEVDGIFMEYLELIEQKIDYNFQKKQYQDWSLLMEDAKNNKIQIILEIQETKSRQSYLKFHSPLFQSQHVIVTRNNATFGNTLESLYDKTIALPKDYGIIENLKRKNPNFAIVTFKDELTCLRQLSTGKYDAFIGPKAVVNYLIRSKKIDNLKINTDIDFSYKPTIAITKKDPVLESIISRVLVNISKEEKEAILDNWFYNKIIPFYKTPKFWILCSLVTLLLFIVGISFNMYLKFKIKQRTKELIIARDIAEESNLLKTNFIKNIPQEIQTPVNGIIGLSEFLNTEELTPEKRKQFTKMIMENSQELLSIIDNILEVSQLQNKRTTLNLVEINLQDTFQALTSYYDSKTIEKNTILYTENELSDAQSLVLLDRSKLNKVLHALLENAVKYTKDGTIIIQSFLENNFLWISINDTGIGIDKKTEEEIRTTLTSSEGNLNTDYNKLGLGLIIAKKNTHFMGGEINLTSEEGVGTTVSIRLPYNPVIKIKTTSTHTNNIYSKTEKHIVLIAEDVETNFLFLKTTLTKMKGHDFTIYRAKNGQEAVTICQENDTIDLVLMDIKMPVMDGYDATKNIKKIRPHLPIIAQTAYSIEEDMQKALLSGCDDFVSKPVDSKILKPILHKYFAVFNNEKRKSTQNKI